MVLGFAALVATGVVVWYSVAMPGMNMKDKEPATTTARSSRWCYQEHPTSETRVLIQVALQTATGRELVAP